jgi:multidrug efflux pump subunit AcrB
MWIVKLALNRPYTFVVLALLIFVLSPLVILRTPTDIFPDIDIPVISVAWTYTGLNPEDLEARLTTPYEKVLTTLVDNIEHIESTTYNGSAVVKIFLQPRTSLDRANAQVVGASQFALRLLPPSVQPPEIINFSASSVPILQLGLSGKGLAEQQLNDLALNFVRTQLITVPGAVVPLPYGGKQRQVMINMDHNLMQARNVSPTDVLNAVNAQSLILPSGTVKLGENELDVRTNTEPRTVAELNNLPIKQVGSTTIYLRDVATVSSANQCGARGWPAWCAHEYSEGWERIDSERGQRRAKVASPRRDDCSTGVKNDGAGGSKHLRSERRQRGYSRGCHRSGADRSDDSVISRQLAKHADYCGLHPTVNFDVYHPD